MKKGFLIDKDGIIYSGNAMGADIFGSVQLEYITIPTISGISMEAMLPATLPNPIWWSIL